MSLLPNTFLWVIWSYFAQPNFQVLFCDQYVLLFILQMRQAMRQAQLSFWYLFLVWSSFWWPTILVKKGHSYHRHRPQADCHQVVIDSMIDRRRSPYDLTTLTSLKAKQKTRMFLIMVLPAHWCPTRPKRLRDFVIFCTAYATESLTVLFCNWFIQNVCMLGDSGFV